VLEFQRNGNPHYHLAVACHGDIRQGFNFQHHAAVRAWNKNRRRGPRPFGSLNRNALLVELHGRLNDTRHGYDVGRMELAPIMSNAEAIGLYVGGYLSKGLPAKRVEHKGARMVCYSQGFSRQFKGRFSWTESGRQWRQKLAIWAHGHGCSDLGAVKALFGPHWAYLHGDRIRETPLPGDESPPPPISALPYDYSDLVARIVEPQPLTPGQRRILQRIWNYESDASQSTPPRVRKSLRIFDYRDSGQTKCGVVPPEPSRAGPSEIQNGTPGGDKLAGRVRSHTLTNKTLVPRLHLQKRLQL
jgi:hypothetical protein